MSTRPRTPSAGRRAGVSRGRVLSALQTLSPCSLTSQCDDSATEIATFAEMAYKPLATEPLG
jgi:hypothetical protein